MSIGLIALLMFLGLFTLFLLGLPISFALFTVSVIFALVFLEPSQVYVIAMSMYGSSNSQVLIAIPLFVLMGNILRYTGIAADMFKCIYYWAGPVRGALAMGTEAICAVFASMSGTSTAGVLGLGPIAIPAMMERNYNKSLTLGSVCSGSLLGIIIPPSILAIIYASIVGISVGTLYLAMFIPGLLLMFAYILYIGIRCAIQPELGPAMPTNERPDLKEKLMVLKGVIAPIFMVVVVLGGMYTGFFTPTEAASVGAAGACLASLAGRSLNWKRLNEAMMDTLKMSSMVIWLIMAATTFSSVYSMIGVGDLIEEVITSLPISGFGTIILMMVSLFVLGMVMDDIAIMLLVAPIYVPLIKNMGFDPLWFAVLFMIMINIAWQSPPYGFNLFYMRAVCPPGITMLDICRSVLPFIVIQLLLLVLIIMVPDIATFLPNFLAATK